MTGVFESSDDDDSLETSVTLAVDETNSEAISSVRFNVLTSTFTSANNDFVMSIKGKVHFQPKGYIIKCSWTKYTP